jgi:hypothetical protein
VCVFVCGCAPAMYSVLHGCLRSTNAGNVREVRMSTQSAILLKKKNDHRVDQWRID